MIDIIKDSSTRIKTGLILFLAALIIGYLDSYFIIWLTLGALLVIALQESMKLFQMESSEVYYYSGALWFVAYFYPHAEDLFFILLLVYASVLAYSKKLDKKIILPLLYPTASFLFLLTLYAEFGIECLLWLLVIVAGTDIGAYFVGRSIGKTKFCETSPKKTLEGVAGGVVVAAILGTIFAIEPLSLFGALIVSVGVSLSSVFGDLFESYLKREAGVKDSGDILPGHGGILDRSDGFLFGAIVMLVILRAVI